jgi:thiosulfate dehydrogenase
LLDGRFALNRALVCIVLTVAAALFASCAPAVQPAASQPAYDPATLPSGPLGTAIAYGRDIVINTQALLPHNVRARMSCQACHLNAGTQDRAGSFVGTYAQFPQWNARAHRVITLQDRLAECFLYSMNGTPPEFSSRETIALVAYIAWLSRATPRLAAAQAQRSYAVPLPSSSPNIAHGAALYAQSCAMCHEAAGAGAGPIPPLWGATSFNNGAGMAHLDRMVGFVHYNMPANAPGSLSVGDAYDVSAFVLSHARPRFRGDARVAFPAKPSAYY